VEVERFDDIEKEFTSRVRSMNKAVHLERNPFVSLAYVRADVQRPLYVDCRATWVEESDERERIWNLAVSEPPPVGFDPTPDFESPANPNFGVLRLSPWRIVLVTFPAASYRAGQRVWRDKTGDQAEQRTGHRVRSMRA
jgi:hypothetical protein